MEAVAGIPALRRVAGKTVIATLGMAEAFAALGPAMAGPASAEATTAKATTTAKVATKARSWTRWAACRRRGRRRRQLGLAARHLAVGNQIGRASCRERV